jgi:hypothetical protein
MVRKLLVCLPVWALLLAGTARADRTTERLEAALYELRSARTELKESRWNFGGHREKAIRAMDEAMVTIKKILRIKRDRDIRDLERKKDFYKAHKDHPRLRQALHDLREARDDVKKSRSKFEGLKERAVRDIDRAIDQIELCIKHAKRGR